MGGGLYRGWYRTAVTVVCLPSMSARPPRVVPNNFPPSTVDGGRFVTRLVPHGRHSSVLAVDERAAALRRPRPRRPRPPAWRHVRTPARRRRRGAFCGNGRAQHAADSPRVSPNSGDRRMFPLDQCSNIRRHRNFQLLVLLADRALLRRGFFRKILCRPMMASYSLSNTPRRRPS